jgi:hypothetical protein
MRVACLCAFAAVLIAGCTTAPPKDYTELRQSRPRSILVLPPLNETADAAGTYSVFTTTTRPLAELGYYVLPLALVDRMLKENGLTMPADMHQAPLGKLREVFGADAVLYIAVESYGTKYVVISSTTVVKARAKLVDCKTGVVLWEGTARVEFSGQSGLVQAVVSQVMSKIMDQAHVVAAMASRQLLSKPGQGLLLGPRHPEFGKD